MFEKEYGGPKFYGWVDLYGQWEVWKDMECVAYGETDYVQSSEDACDAVARQVGYKGASRRKRADFWNPSDMEQSLMDMDNDIWDAHGWNSGNQVRDNWDVYRGDVAKGLSRRGIGHKDITVDVLDGLTDNNFHSLRRALEEIGIFAASRRKAEARRESAKRGIGSERASSATTSRTSCAKGRAPPF